MSANTRPMEDIAAAHLATKSKGSTAPLLRDLTSFPQP